MIVLRAMWIIADHVPDIATNPLLIFLVGIVGKIPPVLSLSVTFSLIAGGVLVSLWKTRGQPAVVAPT